MELQAPILALREAKQRGLAAGVHRIVIHTDSMYVCDNYKRAMFEWPKTRWAKRGGAPVLNAELWKDLVKAIKSTGCIVEFRWVKGHPTDPYNKLETSWRSARLNARPIAFGAGQCQAQANS
jgi:ribonuclease HI